MVKSSLYLEVHLFGSSVLFQFLPLWWKVGFLRLEGTEILLSIGPLMMALNHDKGEILSINFGISKNEGSFY
jgi:hypothetical protein